MMAMEDGISNRKLVRMALLVSAGLILYVFELHIPQPLPWVRIGLANLITIIALVLWGFWEALTVLLARVFLGSIFTGTILSPVFPFALTGGLASVFTMGLAWKYIHPTLSVIGISILGALAHNLTQLILAYQLYVHRGELFYLLPPVLFSTLLTGCVIGVVVALMTARGLLESWRM
jgi:heptaprenyl diphosphate synthase